MISDRSLATLSLQDYIRFDTPDRQVDQVRWFYHDLGDGLTGIDFPGSVTFIDWARDFTAIPTHETFEHIDLGIVPLGFLEGMEPAVIRIMADVPGPKLIFGHSLGAARAYIASGLLSAAKAPPVRAVGFAPPRVGDLMGLIQEFGHGYRWSADPVPEVPLLFLQPCPLTQLGSAAFQIDPFPCHAIGRYAENVPA